MKSETLPSSNLVQQDGPSGDPRLEDFMPRKAGDGSSDADGSQRPVPSAPPAEYPVAGAGPLG